MTKLLGILGFPLRHSVSPVFQQAALDHHGLDVRFEAWECHPQDLEQAIQVLKGPEYLGANVTVPHKEEACACVRLTEDGKFFGAINTIVKRDGEMWGYNTDGYGFLKGLAEGGFRPEGKSVLILGAGGSARAVALTLERERVASITIANRTAERARSLASVLGPWIEEARAIPLEGAALREAASKADLIVNCTSLGMRYSAREGRSPLAAEMISRDALVYDLVYNPPETPLLKEAKKAGAKTIGGLPMLIYQGARAFGLWTGREAPTELMFRAARRALR